MKIADTFCGCPWGNMSDKIRDRLNEEYLNETRLSIIQRKSLITGTYMGSSFLMRETAIENKMSIHIDVSDNDKDARCNWRNVTRNNQSIHLIELPKEHNGYEILKSPEGYDLILLDLYAEFLRDDIVDALVAALTAKIGYNKYKTLPAEPPKDSCGLPMEMVHICSSVTKTAS